MNTLKWVGTGAFHGSKWSILLAVAYTVWFALPEISKIFNGVPAHTVSWASSSEASLSTMAGYFMYLQNSLSIAPYVMLVGVAFGIIPALLIGIVSGGALGGLLSHTAIAPSVKSRLMVGAAFGLLVILLFLGITSMLFTMSDVLWITGIPILVYFGTCLWLSHQMPMLMQRKASIAKRAL